MVALHSPDHCLTDTSVDNVLGNSCMNVFKPGSGPDEASQIGNSEDHAVLSEDSHVYLIPAQWWNSWRQWSGFKVDSTADRDQYCRPGPVDTQCLLKSDNELREGLREAVDYVCVAEATWNKLCLWYPGSGPAIQRPVVVDENNRTRAVVYPIILKVYCHGKTRYLEPRDLHVEATAKLSAVKKQACTLFKANPDDVDLVDYFQNREGKVLEKDLEQLVDSTLVDEQAVLLRAKKEEEEEETGMDLFASNTVHTRTVRSGFSFALEDTCFQRSGVHPGLAGLGNLGNTCFMNSSLQCLAHTVPLMSAFLSGEYVKDLNHTNPLGMKGELAEAFGSLMDLLWKGNISHVTPKAFKSKIGRFAPQFSGYQQHDSQEFLAFLLDGLHEDVNRIKNKPYIEDKESTGSDEQLAEEAWTNYRARNNSLVVDHFQGLYKSQLDCPKCQYHSVKFDPFMYLSLPLPESRMRVITPILVDVSGDCLPMRYALELPNSGTIKDLINKLADVAVIHDAPAEQIMLAARVERRGFTEEVTLYTDTKTRLADVVGSQSWVDWFLVVYVFPSPEEGPTAGEKVPVVVHQKTFPASPYAQARFDGVPLVLYMQPENIFQPEQVTKQGTVGPTYELQQSASMYRRVRPVLRPLLADDAPELVEQEPAVVAEEAGDQTMAEADGNPPVAPSGSAEPTSDSANAAQLDAMQLDDAATVPQTQQEAAEPQHAAMPADTVRDSTADVEMNSTAVVSNTVQDDDDLYGDGPAVKPFNMWEGTGHNQAADSVQVGAASAPSPPFRLLLAKSKGEDKWYMADKLEECRNVVLEWQREHAPYDLARFSAPADHETYAQYEERSKHGSQPVTLAACVEAFLQPEQLSEADSWYCPRCKEHVQADKKLDLWALPEVLVVHLKRFSYTRYSREKLDTLVDFPLHSLDLSQYVLPIARAAKAQECQASHSHNTPDTTHAQPADVQMAAADNSLAAAECAQHDHSSAPTTASSYLARAPVYDLYAVSNHYGSLGGGHYTAYARMPDEHGDWFSFDDSHVSPVRNPQDVVTSSAYVLFYRRRHEAQRDPPDLLSSLLARHQQLQREHAQQAAAAASDQQPEHDQGREDVDNNQLISARHPSHGQLSDYNLAVSPAIQIPNKSPAAFASTSPTHPSSPASSSSSPARPQHGTDEHFGRSVEMIPVAGSLGDADAASDVADVGSESDAGSQGAQHAGKYVIVGDERFGSAEDEELEVVDIHEDVPMDEDKCEGMQAPGSTG